MGGCAIAPNPRHVFEASMQASLQSCDGGFGGLSGSGGVYAAPLKAHSLQPFFYAPQRKFASACARRSFARLSFATGVSRNSPPLGPTLACCMLRIVSAVS